MTDKAERLDRINRLIERLHDRERGDCSEPEGTGFFYLEFEEGIAEGIAPPPGIRIKNLED